MARRYLITGATGFIGGHVAEACASRGLPVSTIARAGSDTDLLERQGVTILRGDLLDPEVVRKAVEGADVVVQCGAKVGDRGPVEDYRAVNVGARRGLLEPGRQGGEDLCRIWRYGEVVRGRVRQDSRPRFCHEVAWLARARIS